MKKEGILLVILLVLFDLAVSNPPLFPKKLWVYWHTPIESAPFFVKLCVQKMKMACQEANWDFYLLNDTNLAELLPNYQKQFLPVRNNAKHPGWWASVADLIRLAVIDQNGGLYLDISTILFQGLEWLEQLENFPYLLTNSDIQKGQYPEVMQSYLGYYQSSAEVRDSQGKITNYFPGYESWFLAAKPKSPYISALRKRHAHHYQRTQSQNKMQDFQKRYYLRYIQGEYLNNQKSAYEVLQETQFQLDKNLTLLSERINVNRHFKLVGFHAQYGPLTFYLNLIAKQQLLTYTLEQIQKEYYIPINFLLKLTNQDRHYIDDKLNQLINLAETYPNIREDFQKFMGAKPSHDQCKNLKLIVEDSVFGRFIKDNREAVQKKLFAISKQQRNRWLSYCKKTYNQQKIKVNSQDNRTKIIIHNILQVTNLFLSQQTNLKINQLLQIIAGYYNQATNHMMGGFSDVEQLYYWKKLYDHKNTNSSHLISGNNTSKTKNKPLNEYYSFELLYLRLKLKVLSNRNSLALNFKIFNYLLLFTCSLALVFFFISISVKLIFLILKFTVLSFQKIWRSLAQQGQAQSIEYLLKENFQKHTQKLSIVTNQQIFSILSKLVVFTLKRIGIATLVLAFVIFNSIVCFKYFAVVYLGLIYHQQFKFLVIMIVQILFRKAFQKIGQNTWGLPGLTLGELRRIYLPIYWFALGASIVGMAERVEVRNFALASSLTLILPPLIRQIEIQIKKVYHKDELKSITIHSKKNVFRVATNCFSMILTKLSSVIEIIIISFLVSNIFLPNMRFLVYNQAYMIKSFFTFLCKLKIVFFIILVILYVFELYKKIKQIRKDIDYFNVISRQKYQEERESNKTQMNQSSFMKSDQQSFSQTSISEVSQLNILQENLKKKVNLTLPSSKFIFFEILTATLKIANYSVKIYVFYELLFNPWQQMIIRNTFTISIQQSLVWLEVQRQRVALKIMAVLAIFFINFELEKYLEQIFINFYSQSEQKNTLLNFKEKQQYYHFNQETSQTGSFDLNQMQRVTKWNQIGSLLLLSETLFLAMPRIFMIITIYSYLKTVDANNKVQKQKMEKQFFLLLCNMAIIIFLGFKMTKEIIARLSLMEIRRDKPNQCI